MYIYTHTCISNFGKYHSWQNASNCCGYEGNNYGSSTQIEIHLQHLPQVPLLYSVVYWTVQAGVRFNYHSGKGVKKKQTSRPSQGTCSKWGCHL